MGFFRAVCSTAVEKWKQRFLGRRRILTYRWHVPHQYELYKSGHIYHLASGAGTAFCDNWEWDQRPLPNNARFVPYRRVDSRKYDIAIIHFDQDVYLPSSSGTIVPGDWGKNFQEFLTGIDIPKVAICHGTPPFKQRFTEISTNLSELSLLEEERKRIVEALGDIPVVCNSHQALKEWGFRNSRVIWHGFSPDEFLPRSRRGGVYAMSFGGLQARPTFNGLHIFNEVKAALDRDIEIKHIAVSQPEVALETNPSLYARKKFQNYREVLGTVGVYMNPTLRSPMPRTRSEAMMSGAVSVSLKNHDVDMFIRNGENGFYCESAAEIAEKISWLIAHPDSLETMAEASRETAMREFHIDRFLDQWENLLSFF